MDDRMVAGRGFTVLDGVALVTGAAVASVHIRSVVPRVAGPFGWFWAWCLFSWLALTSAGPFLFLVRKFFTRPEGYPRSGDRLWAFAGLPWVVAAMVRTFESPVSSKIGLVRPDPAYAGILALGLALFAFFSVASLASRYLQGAKVSRRSVESTPWSDRLGIFLGVTWPIQCGVGLVIVG